MEAARELIAQKRRQQALLSLRKKKLHEQRVDTIDAYLLNVEQVRLSRQGEADKLGKRNCRVLAMFCKSQPAQRLPACTEQLTALHA